MLGSTNGMINVQKEKCYVVSLLVRDSWIPYIMNLLLLLQIHCSCVSISRLMANLTLML